ncbi:hypothetical protein [Mesorhizobium sophorae]|nr:hypothetical protein [Mesorhizobium sophorae]
MASKPEKKPKQPKTVLPPPGKPQQIADAWGMVAGFGSFGMGARLS